MVVETVIVVGIEEVAEGHSTVVVEIEEVAEGINFPASLKSNKIYNEPIKG